MDEDTLRNRKNSLKDCEVDDYFQSLLKSQTEDIIKEISILFKNEERENTNQKILLLEKQVIELKAEIDEVEKEKEFAGKKAADSYELYRDSMKKVLQKNEELQNQNYLIKNLKDEVTALNSKILKQQQDFDEMSQEISSIQIENEKFKGKYFNLEEAYQGFYKLSVETKDRLKNIFQTESIEGFLSAGLQWENIEGIWNFLKRKIIEGDYREVEILREIFIYLFDTYNQRFSMQLYTLINPNVGDRYDSDQYIILGTKTDGNVIKVLLEGFVNNRTGKIIHKALIEV